MAARDDNPELHRIEVTRDSDGEVTKVRFVCGGDDAAPCHHWPDCGCESWGEAHGDPKNGVPPEPGHEDVRQLGCWMDPWFNATTISISDWLDLYSGDDPALDTQGGGYVVDIDWSHLVSGPVSCTFEGDYMTWEYAAPLSPNGATSETPGGGQHG